MEEIIKKADILIEALPYIKSFYSKVVVIKVGGTILTNEDVKLGILEDIVFMNYVGMKPILIHGGGNVISQRLRERGKKSEFVHGLRITDSESIDIVVETLLDINRNTIKELKRLGSNARGLDPHIDKFIKAAKLVIDKNRDLGYVGRITSLDVKIISKLLNTDTIPVIPPLGVGKSGKIYNINADDLSAAVAIGMRAEKLVLLTNAKGILRSHDDEESLISSLDEKEIEDLIGRNIIQSGMIPKVMACVSSLKGDVKKAHIIDGRIPHALLLEIFTDRGIGTEIVHERK